MRSVCSLGIVKCALFPKSAVMQQEVVTFHVLNKQRHVTRFRNRPSLSLPFVWRRPHSSTFSSATAVFRIQNFRGVTHRDAGPYTDTNNATRSSSNFGYAIIVRKAQYCGVVRGAHRHVPQRSPRKTLASKKQLILSKKTANFGQKQLILWGQLVFSSAIGFSSKKQQICITQNFHSRRGSASELRQMATNKFGE